MKCPTCYSLSLAILGSKFPSLFPWSKPQSGLHSTNEHGQYQCAEQNENG